MVRTVKSTQLPGLSPLDRSAGQLGRQLAQQLRDAIRSGSLRPGEPLPATRHLATALKVARGTVVEAFEQLVAEGFLESRMGAGTAVATHIPSSAKHTPKRATPNRIIRPLSATVARYAAIADAFRPLPGVPFAISVPTGAAAPGDVWRKLGNRVRATRSAAPAGYADPQGLLRLRRAIADYVRKSRSVTCDAEQVIVTSGTQQGLYLACQVLLGETDQAWVEDPAYLGLTRILESIGPPGRIVRVPVDEEGLVVDEGVRRAPLARAAFVTPSHQFPLGMPLSMRRREALLDWARACNAWVVEDDYDSELRYAGHPFPSLQGLDNHRVVYLGTFSKILFPSLRLGYVIAPADLVSAFCGARIVMDRHPPTADQHVLATYISEGYLDRHIRRIRSAYAESRAALVRILQAHLPPGLVGLQPSDQGMHLVAWLDDRLDDVQIAQTSIARGVAVRPLSPTYSAKSRYRRPGLILGFGGFSSEQMIAAAITLGEVIQQAAGPAGH